MERRGFLKFLGASVAGIALEQAIPFNRVWSFPKEIIFPVRRNRFLTNEEFEMEWVRALHNNLKFVARFNNNSARFWDEDLAIGSTVNIRLPQRFTSAVPRPN